VSGWSLDNTDIDDEHNGLSIIHLPGLYQNNFVLVNRVCNITNAYAAGLSQASVHWYVDPSAHLRFKKIDVDNDDGAWDRYWGGTEGTDPGTQASSTIIVKEDMILYGFRKNVEEYANHIVLATDFRRPP